MKTEAEILKETASRKEKEATQAKARADRAIAAAEAILIPLGFTRAESHRDRFGNAGEFSQWRPAAWYLESPRARASLTLQNKPWSARKTGDDDDGYIYRLEVAADSAFDVKAVRVAPGNAEGVKSYLARVEVARQSHDKRQAGDAKKASLVEEMFAHDYPNLKVVRVEVSRGLTEVTVKTKTGIGLTITLIEHRFSSIKCDPYEERTTAIDNLKAALKAL